MGRRAVGGGQSPVGGALGLHHGLEALVALSGHVGAAGRHAGDVAGGRRGWGPVRQRRRLVHGGRVGRRRDLDFGEIAGFHRAWRLSLAQGGCEGWLPVCRGETGHCQLWDGSRQGAPGAVRVGGDPPPPSGQGSAPRPPQLTATPGVPGLVTATRAIFQRSDKQLSPLRPDSTAAPASRSQRLMCCHAGPAPRLQPLWVFPPCSPAHQAPAVPAAHGAPPAQAPSPLSSTNVCGAPSARLASRGCKPRARTQHRPRAALAFGRTPERWSHE